jgi:hypothetical protein
MVYRLPTQLESFVPPPSEQLQLSRPWRGTFVVNIANGTGNGTSQEVRVTAAETEGERSVCVVKRFFVSLMRTYF